MVVVCSQKVIFFDMMSFAKLKTFQGASFVQESAWMTSCQYLPKLRKIIVSDAFYFQFPISLE